MLQQCVETNANQIRDQIMSARNWTACPKCAIIKEAELTKLINKTEDSYGKVPAQEYRALLNKQEGLKNEINNPPERMGENYQFTFSDLNKCTVHYSAYCNLCGFKFSFNHEELIQKSSKE